MAVMHARGELRVGEDFIHESIVGSIFTGRLEKEEEFFGRKAVIPRVSGRAYITQYCEVVLDEEDPFPEGYTVGDIR